jgi:hypothetical protein
VNDLYRAGDSAQLKAITVRSKPSMRAVTFVSRLQLKSILKQIRRLTTS